MGKTMAKNASYEVIGARRELVMMTHVTSKGEPEIVKSISHPLTARRCVTPIFTDLAVISVTPAGRVLEAIAPGLTIADVQAVTEATLSPGERLAWQQPASPLHAGAR